MAAPSIMRPSATAAMPLLFMIMLLSSAALGQEAQVPAAEEVPEADSFGVSAVRPPIFNLSLVLDPANVTVYPKSSCDGDQGTQPDFERLAEVKYSSEELQSLMKQTMAEVKAKRAEVLNALRNITTAWQAYCQQYNLQAIQFNSRYLKIFTRNLQTYASQNRALDAAGDDTLAYGITQFAHMTSAEFARTMLDETMAAGRTTDNPLRRRLLQGSTPCNLDVGFPWGSISVPSSWDWRAAGVITPIKSQGGCGSCSAFASMATIESTFIRKWWSKGYRSYNTDLAEDDWLECTSGNQCKGAWPDSVLDRFICKGTPFESAQPYNAHDSNTCKVIPRYNTGAKRFAYVPANSASLARSVRMNPTVIAVDASNWQGLAAGWVRNCGEPWSKINHAVTVVGWVDDVPMSNGQTWDYWFVRNSWGSGFVNSGYIWIRKDCSGNGPYGMYNNEPWTPLM